ncbi:MAG: glycosyltransferase, partial [Gemmatimonadales bacterium]
DELVHHDRMEWYGQVNVLKGGLVFADMATTVSSGHAHELRTRAGGFGLDDTFIALQDRFVGIVNGIDDQIWDPSTDTDIEANYSKEDLAGKAECKAWLQEACGLKVDPRIPLVAMVARMVAQKGLDLILSANLLGATDAQYLFLGSGERRYEEALAALAARAPSRIAAYFDFTHARERQLLAGADVLLMPSLYEPCGLTQMRALRYGTLPVARRVGGLADTIEDQMTGFLFDTFEPAALERGLKRAFGLFEDSETWRRHVREAMTRDFSWSRSVERYLEVYESAFERRSRQA